MMQDWFWAAGPVQFMPHEPKHERVWVCVPVPHDMLHVVHALHADHEKGAPVWGGSCMHYYNKTQSC